MHQGKMYMAFATVNRQVFIRSIHFLQATLDFLCECNCCGLGCGKVKCPFCIEGLDFDSYVQMKSSCLEKINQNLP